MGWVREGRSGVGAARPRTDPAEPVPSTPMSQPPASFEHYLAAWNEPNPDAIGAHLALAVAADVVFADPANHTTGVPELEAMIRSARTDLPNAEYRVTSGIDGGHDHRYRYLWAVVIDGAAAVVGMDCTTVDGTGRITRIDGFFGDFPAP